MATACVRSAAWLAVLLGASWIVAGCGSSTPARDPGTVHDSDVAMRDSREGPAEVGKLAPALSMQVLNGKGDITTESLRGKVAIVDFWATWCAPCKQSFPKLEEIAKQNPDTVRVVGVSVDDAPDGIVNFAKASGATFPVGWDEGHAIANRWKVDSMPTTYILDTTGKIRFVHAGYHDGEAELITKELLTLVPAVPASATKTATDATSAKGESGKSAGKDASSASGAGGEAGRTKNAPGSTGSGTTETASPGAGKKGSGKTPAKAGGGKKSGAKPATSAPKAAPTE